MAPANREALFSPATSSLASRILPICCLAMKEHTDCVMAAIDVKDAFSQSSRLSRLESMGRKDRPSVWVECFLANVMGVCFGIVIWPNMFDKVPWK